MFRKFETEDLQKITLQTEQKMEFDTINVADNALTFEHNGLVRAVVWYVLLDDKRAAVFALISADIGLGLVGLVRQLKVMIEEQSKILNLNRVEMCTLKGFAQADRLAKMLGFEHEGCMRKVFKGLDYNLYARVK